MARRVRAAVLACAHPRPASASHRPPHRSCGSALSPLPTAAPEPWERGAVPPRYWAAPEHRRRFVRWCAHRLGLIEPAQWVHVSSEQVAALGGRTLVERYALCELVQDAYPAHRDKLHAWLFRSVPSGFWEHATNRTCFILWCARQLLIRERDEWYRVTPSTMARLGGQTPYKRYTLPALLREAYPGWDVLDWRFPHLLGRFWDEPDSRRRFLVWATTALCLTSLDQWYPLANESSKSYALRYTIRRAQLLPLGGEGLLARYRLCDIVPAAFPEHAFHPWLFHYNPDRWASTAIQRAFLDHVQAKLGFTSLDGWYHIRATDLQRFCRGGSALIRRYGSVSALVVHVYPEHTWEPWRFYRCPNRKMNTERSQVAAVVAHTAKLFHVHTLHDWYRVAWTHAMPMGARVLLPDRSRRLKDWMQLLQIAHPNEAWSWPRMRKRFRKAQQKVLVDTLKALFPDADVLEEHTLVGIVHTSARPVVVDAYVAQHTLAVEYHGPQHYRDASSYHLAPLHLYQQRDADKAAACARHGVTLVGVPYWWDRSLGSLAATLCLARPDLFRETDDSRGTQNTTL